MDMRNILSIQPPIPYGSRHISEDSEHQSYSLTALGRDRVKQIDDRSPEFIVLASVEEMGTCTANDVARMSHFSITKVQHVLKVLQRAGLVKIGMGGAE